MTQEKKKNIMFETRMVKKCCAILKTHIKSGEHITNDDIKKEDSELGSVIFDRKEPENIGQGYARKVHYFGLALKSFPEYQLHDFFWLGDKYWTDWKILEVMKIYIERNGTLNGFSTEHNPVAQRIRRGKGFDYYIDQLTLLYNFDEDKLRQHQTGYWTFEKFKQLCLALYKETGSLTTGNWLRMGYPETPLNMYSIKNVREDLGIKHYNRGLDGQEYRSYFEVLVANILHIMRINYSKDVEFEPDVSKRSCDFVIRKTDLDYLEHDLYIEVAGRNDDNYQKDLEAKLLVYESLGNHLVIDTRVFKKADSGDLIVQRICERLGKSLEDAKSIELSYKDVFRGYKEKMTIDEFRNEISLFLRTETFLPSIAELLKAKQYRLIRYIKENGGIDMVANSMEVRPYTHLKHERQTMYTMTEMAKKLRKTMNKQYLDDYPCLEKLKYMNPPLYSAIRNKSRYAQVIKYINFLDSLKKVPDNLISL